MKWPLFAIAAAMLGSPSFAHAWLGGDVASVQADQQRMNADVASTSTRGYTTYEMQTPSGTRVKEFVSPSGRVFAVAWQGPALPDMRQLLGAFFTRYVTADNALGAAAASRLIDEPGFVVQAGGHMRAFVGRAYIPESIPAEVSVADLH